MTDYRAPKHDNNHPADEWKGEARSTPIHGKPVEDAIVILRKTAEGLEDTRFHQGYSETPYLTGFRPKTQAERDREAKKKAAEEAREEKKRAARKAEQERYRVERETERKRQERDRRKAAKEQAEALVAVLREAGYVVVKAAKKGGTT